MLILHLEGIFVAHDFKDEHSFDGSYLSEYWSLFCYPCYCYLYIISIPCDRSVVVPACVLCEILQLCRF